MNLKVIKYYLIFLLAFFSWVNIVYANLDITEIMYDPEGADTNREWIKLYNSGNEVINIISGKTASSWRFGDGENGESLHFISESLEITPGGYAIIASDKNTFIEEYPSFSGPVADTSMSLSNISGIVKIFDGSNPRRLIASQEYNTNEPMEEIIEENSNTTEYSDNSTSSTSSTKKETEPEVFKITTKIIAPKIVTAGIPFSFNSLTTTNTGKTYAVGRFSWNFGNGDNLKTNKATPFEYVYEYEGEYAVSLYYYDSSFSIEPDAVHRITIKVVPSEIYISSVGDNTNPFIEIENKSNYEVDLSNWIVRGGIHYFTIPDGTILLPHKKIKLSPKITGFVGEDIKYVVITNQDNGIVTTYPSSTRKLTQRNSSARINVKNDTMASNSDNSESSIKDNQEVINLNDLAGSAEGSGVKISKSTYAWIGLILIIGLGVASFLMIKRRRDYDDYIEKEIRAEDMTILE